MGVDLTFDASRAGGCLASEPNASTYLSKAAADGKMGTRRPAVPAAELMKQPAARAAPAAATDVRVRAATHAAKKSASAGRVWLREKQQRVGQSRQRRPGEVCSETKEGARTAAGEATATARRDTRDVCHGSKVAGSRDAASSSPAQQPIPEGTPSTRWPKQPSDHGLFEL
eukprot:COSAG03_NODE_1038_length_4984_cov_8.852405_3_plen_171_part_00